MNSIFSPGITLAALIALVAISPSSSASRLPSEPADLIVLRVPCFSDQRHQFYVQLLRSSLDAVRQSAQIKCVYDLPGRRMWKMVGDGKLDLIWGVQTPDKDKGMVPIQVALTDGLVGQRVLLIRPEDQKVFDSVNSIQALRETELVAGFGEGWFDAKVWRTNGLPVYEFPHQFSLIYSMVSIGNRGVDYLPRGANEIVTEAQQHKRLIIEKHLLFYYDRDMRFYLSPHAAAYKPIVENALKAAEASGLKRRLIDRAFGSDIKALNLTQRRRIQLQVLD
ncbi:hypothetical protein [Massilia soli]|uniref:Transporter substrate-binding domain-containing protein n=1 Tax=Massilia soli TaxID=2792854 RepID=A0ABS7SUK5_9BURK|nr:hypothetical protein [Massilia soli]MBZ2209610.1 hypothetical protein [Massilia soli]